MTTLTNIWQLARPSIKKIKPYSPGKSSQEVMEELGIAEVTKLASNENPLGPSPQAVSAMQQAADGVYVYPDPLCRDLTEALADHWEFDPEGIVVGRGSDEVIHMLGLAFLNPGDEVIYSDPPFALYPLTTTIMDSQAVAVHHRNFVHDLPAMGEAITDKTKMIFISNPYNPTGTIVTDGQVDEFMGRVPDHVVVVFDEAYYEYVDDTEFGEGMPYVREGRAAIVLRTFSKAYALAGLRIGYGMAPPQLSAVLKQVRPPFNVAGMAQAAALASLQDPEQIERSRRLVQEGKRYLYGQFEDMGLVYVPTQANFILVDVGIDSQECFDGLMRQGVTVRTGDIFGLPTYIRVTIGTGEQNQRFIRALQEVVAQ